MTVATNPAPDDIEALRAALAAALLARREAEARASGAEAMVAYLKLLTAKLRHEQFGASSERLKIFPFACLDGVQSADLASRIIASACWRRSGDGIG